MAVQRGCHLEKHPYQRWGATPHNRTWSLPWFGQRLHKSPQKALLSVPQKEPTPQQWVERRIGFLEQTYLFYSRDTHSRLSRGTPRNPLERSSSQMLELCCEERNIGYIFNSPPILCCPTRQLQRLSQSKPITSTPHKLVFKAITNSLLFNSQVIKWKINIKTTK